MNTKQKPRVHKAILHLYSLRNKPVDNVREELEKRCLIHNLHSYTHQSERKKEELRTVPASV